MLTSPSASLLALPNIPDRKGRFSLIQAQRKFFARMLVLVCPPVNDKRSRAFFGFSIEVRDPRIKLLIVCPTLSLSSLAPGLPLLYFFGISLSFCQLKRRGTEAIVIVVQQRAHNHTCHASLANL
jgi:hypothetical protein